MSAVILTPADIANVEQIKTDQTSIVTASNRTISDLTTKQIPATQAKENSNKKIYDKQHDIITKYEIELTNLNGVVITSPVVEQDIIDRSNFTGRLYDTTGAIRDLIRIPEFDGGNTTTNADSELVRFTNSNYSDYMSRLTTGLATTTALTATTISTVTPSSTSVVFGSNVSAIAGKQFEIHSSSAGQSFIGLCSTVTSNGVSAGSHTSGLLVVGVTYTITTRIAPDSFLNVGAANNNNGTSFIATGTTPSTWTAGSTLTTLGFPATQWTVNFSFLTAITSNISSGAPFTGTWTGFTNTERTNKSSTVPFSGARQTIMNYLISQLQTHINAQLAFENAEKAALLVNYDPLLPAGALTDVNSAITYYSGYTANPDISDSGLSTLTTHNSTRLGQVNARVTALIAARLPFFDKRFFWAVERAGASGTLVQLKQFDSAITAANTRKTAAQTKLATMAAGVI